MRNVADEISPLLISMRGLLLLADRHDQSDEAQHLMELMSKCLDEIDAIMKNHRMAIKISGTKPPLL